MKRSQAILYGAGIGLALGLCMLLALDWLRDNQEWLRRLQWIHRPVVAFIEWCLPHPSKEAWFGIVMIVLMLFYWIAIGIAVALIVASLRARKAKARAQSV